MVNDNTPTKQRLIITFGKFGALKYTSNLDIAKVWERVLRRADLPLLYSRGFNTRPRLQLATALPLGISSECELVDVSLKEVIEIDQLVEHLQSVSPEGLRIYGVEEASLHTPALQTLVRSAEYRIQFLEPVDRSLLETRIQQLLEKDTILKMVERKNRKSAYDLRPLIHDLRVDEQGDLIAHLATGEQGNVRPDDILAQLSLHEIPHNVHRLHLHLIEAR
ncbi:MAG: TIGR03936 family radical SAM-associated protein [Anaerolineae bacterium]|nr:TIGR03936 family radical SAM-associated protein [Anaerolineae bacterium]